jgi:hypothetical protein
MSMARTFGLDVLVLLCCPLIASAQTAPVATVPVHGLRGAYYTPHLDKSFPDYKALAFDAFHIPTPLKEPEAVRIDPQIAFGRGKGFDRSKGQLQWFPHPQTAAVVWTGYIRFPTPGTYFLVTVSDDSSAVWLNDARICLNGWPTDPGNGSGLCSFCSPFSPSLPPGGQGVGQPDSRICR